MPTVRTIVAHLHSQTGFSSGTEYRIIEMVRRPDFKLIGFKILVKEPGRQRGTWGFSVLPRALFES